MNAYQWSDLQVGISHSFETRVTEAMMRRFEEDTGDRNPLHTDAGFARDNGFHGPVVYGLLSSSFYSTLVGVHLPGKHALLQGIQIKFLQPIYVDQLLHVQGRITHLSEAVRRIEVEARINAPDGKAFSTAKIQVGLHE